METTYMVIGDNFEVETLKIKDEIIEDYIDVMFNDDDDDDFEEIIGDLFAEYCLDEFGWLGLRSAYELLDDGTWYKIF